MAENWTISTIVPAGQQQTVQPAATLKCLPETAKLLEENVLHNSLILETTTENVFPVAISKVPRLYL